MSARAKQYIFCHSIQSSGHYHQSQSAWSQENPSQAIIHKSTSDNLAPLLHNRLSHIVSLSADIGKSPDDMAVIQYELVLLLLIPPHPYPELNKSQLTHSTPLSHCEPPSPQPIHRSPTHHSGEYQTLR
jgi:hypothetical protein